MTGRRYARERATAHEAVTPDHYPVCPGCGNTCGMLAVICVDCGARLHEDPMSRADRVREDLSPYKEKGS